MCASRLRIIPFPPFFLFVCAFSLFLSAFVNRRVSSQRWRAIMHHELILSYVLMVARSLVLSSRRSTRCLRQPPLKSKLFNHSYNRDRNCNTSSRPSSPSQHPSAGLGPSQLSLTSRTLFSSTKTYVTYCSVLTSPATPRCMVCR